MQQPRLIAGPARSAVTEVRFQICEVGTRVGTSILASLPPERQPLTGMAVTYSLNGAHDDKHGRPERYVGQVPRARRQRSSQCSRIESPDKARSYDAINRQYAYVQDR